MHLFSSSSQRRAGCLLAVVAGTMSAFCHADWFDTLQTSVTGSDVGLDFRYRYELVDAENFDKDAHASTLRSRLTWTSGAIGAWMVGAEADYVAVVGSERYNSLSNGRVEYPVVADPKGFDLNQVFVRYTQEDFAGTAGRQRINHGNQRFIGGVAWRQNEQTYDGLRLELDGKVRLDYAYTNRVNRIFGPDDGVQPRKWNSNSHLFRADVELAKGHQLHAYGYLLDFRNGNGPNNSNATLGLEYRGKVGPVSLAAALARQSDYGRNPVRYDATYYLLEGKFAASDDFGATLGYEVLGSDDGEAGFATPLATLHIFQGWADIFLNTPADGVRDAYLGLNGKVGRLSLGAIYHWFGADRGGSNFGEELNLVAGYPLHKALNLQLKYANYQAKRFAQDTTKFWLTLQLKI